MKKILSLLLVATLMVAFTSKVDSVKADGIELVSFNNVDVAVDNATAGNGITNAAVTTANYDGKEILINGEVVEYDSDNCQHTCVASLDEETSNEPEPNLTKFTINYDKSFEDTSPILLTVIKTNVGKNKNFS